MENIGILRNMASIYLQHNNKMLLLYRQGSRVVNNVWVGSAGGHFEECELNDAKSCVLRELEEELSITEDMICNLELRYITLRRTYCEIRQNYYFFANLTSNLQMDISSNEGVSKWFTLNELTGLKMPFTSQYVMEHYLKVGMHNHNVYGGIADGSKVVFTELSEF
jgi:8-oxo-dGTP diphosphatase